MQQSPNYNQNPGNQDPQNPQMNPSNQTFINTTPVSNMEPANNMSQNTADKSKGVEKIIQLVWFVVGFINVVLALRIVFLLFNAQQSGFTGALYSITRPFVMAFNGIFPAPSQGNTYFDTAALVAIIIYSLASWGIVTLIRIISDNQKTA